jgi:hemoglobin
MNDIETREDIEKLVAAFYKKAIKDKVIGYIFTDVAKINLDHHLPIIADFWEMLLLGTVNFQAKYRRSPMQIHHALNEKEPLQLEHFARWVKLFCETIDEKFSGETANLAKIRAISIADTMRIRFSSETAAGVQIARG